MQCATRWHLRVPAVLWAYRTNCKKFTGDTPFRLVYGQEVVVPMEFIVTSFRIIAFTDMEDTTVEAEHMSQLLELEEDSFIAGFQQKVQNVRDKA